MAGRPKQWLMHDKQCCIDKLFDPAGSGGQVFKSKLDEESRARVYAVRDMGKNAAALMCNPETNRPLDGPSPAAAPAQGEPPDPQPYQGDGYHFGTGTTTAWSRVSAMEPTYGRVDASRLAAEAVARNAESAPADASGGIADILRGPRGGESGPPKLSNASTMYQNVTQEALQGHKTVAGEAGAPPFLRKAFSLCERDDAPVDLAHLNTLQKVGLDLRRPDPLVRIPSLHIPCQ